MDAQRQRCRLLWLCSGWKWRHAVLSQHNSHLYYPGSGLWNILQFLCPGLRRDMQQLLQRPSGEYSRYSTGAACYISNVVMFQWNNTLNPPPSPLAPCPPDGLLVELLPMVNGVQVMRFSWTEIICHDTEYILILTGNLLGDSQAQFEVSSYWTSATYFEIPLPCGSAYVATVMSRSAAGTSDLSVPLSGTTGRLHFELL